MAGGWDSARTLGGDSCWRTLLEKRIQDISILSKILVFDFFFLPMISIELFERKKMQRDFPSENDILCRNLTSQVPFPGSFITRVNI